MESASQQSQKDKERGIGTMSCDRLPKNPVCILGRGLRELTNWRCTDLQPAGDVKTPENTNPTCPLCPLAELEGAWGEGRGRKQAVLWSVTEKHKENIPLLLVLASKAACCERVKSSLPKQSMSVLPSLSPQCPSNSP